MSFMLKFYPEVDKELAFVLFVDRILQADQDVMGCQNIESGPKTVDEFLSQTPIVIIAFKAPDIGTIEKQLAIKRNR